MHLKHLLLFSTLTLLIISSCKIDPCEDATCNNGTAIQDAYDCFCLCDKGWFGDNCDIEDACQTNTIDCYNGGTCLNGDCLCDLGFEGDTCEIVIRDYYIGNYTADLNCPPNTQVISFSIIAPDSLVVDATDIFLVNITNQSYLIEGRIDENGDIIIPNQSNQVESISGTVIRTPDGFIIDYELKDAVGSEFCEIEIQK